MGPTPLQPVPPGALKLDLKHDAGKPAGSGPSRRGGRPGRRRREVTAGFTKEDILRDAPADPRAEGGLLERVLGVLEALSDGR